jgi:hypothetical protein
MKYFVVSDIHSYFNCLIEALEKEGFQKNNNNHMLIINGDIFDRGKESQEIRDFLDTVENKVLIFGNHEYLMLHAINRGNFLRHDISNGTLDAAIQLSGGYKRYPDLSDITPKEFFNVVDPFNGKLDNVELQKEIIKNLIDTDIVEWIVENFYLDGSKVKWNKDKTEFKIYGKPRYYIQVEDRLITHGFIPCPDFIKMYTTKNDVKYANLPDDYDLLEESSQKMWEEEYGEGIWSNTPYWLKLYHKYKLPKFYDYLIRKNIKHIYLGHWTKSDLENMVVSVSMTPDYIKYNGKLPKLYFTDGAVVSSKEVLVETFEIE